MSGAAGAAQEGGRRVGAVLTGFATLAVIVALGYLLGRFAVLGTGADVVLSRLTFFVATPALMFRTVAAADVTDIFSAGALVNVLTVVVAGLAYLVVARFLLGRRGAARSSPSGPSARATSTPATSASRSSSSRSATRRRSPRSCCSSCW